jgi:hypothetical protein
LPCGLRLSLPEDDDLGRCGQPEAHAFRRLGAPTCPPYCSSRVDQATASSQLRLHIRSAKQTQGVSGSGSSLTVKRSWQGGQVSARAIVGEEV